MKTLLCLAALGLMFVTGCSAAGPQSADAGPEVWPRVSLEMRVLMVDAYFIEEFGPDTSRGVPGFPDLTPPGSFLQPIRETNTNLLVTCALASQGCLSLSAPRLTLPPGQDAEAWIGPQISFITNDLGNEHLRDEGGLGLEARVEMDDPADAASPLRMVVVARFLPEGVYRGDEMQWRGSAGAQAYSGLTIRVQAICESGTTYLAAAPAPDPNDPDALRMLLLFKPVLVASPEEELQFYPGLSEPPAPPQ